MHLEAQTLVIGDTHAHVYPVYDLALYFRSAFERFRYLEAEQVVGDSSRSEPPTAVRLLMLAERSDCRFFSTIRGRGEIRLAEFICRAMPADPNALQVERADGSHLYIIAGRQVATAERLELLSLCSPTPIPDGLSMRQTLDSVLQVGGIPVLNWAPGKWLFKRGAIVRSLLVDRRTQLLSADVSLRPTPFPLPTLLTFASLLGIARLAGSDPLPFCGEERQIAGLCSSWITSFQDDVPAHSARKLLEQTAAGAISVKTVGRRNGWGGVWARLQKNKKVARRRFTDQDWAHYPSYDGSGGFRED